MLTSQTNTPGVANVDFVIFPERWMVAENTFRPPYYHRNIMSEFMGSVYGTYDAKSAEFQPGSSSLHNCMTPHGPDSDSWIAAQKAELKPKYYADTLAFMFESSLVWQATDYALQSSTLQKNYVKCWQGLPVNFSLL